MPDTATRKNKVKFNLKNVHMALLSVSDAGVYSYDTPVAVPGAVSLSMDAEGESSPFYADGIVYFRSVNNNGYSGSLELAYVDDWIRENILQETVDTNGVLVEKSDVTEQAKFAMLFEFDGDVNAIRHVLYCCTASRPSIASQTKEQTIEPVTETLDITADPRDDNLVKCKTGAETDSTVYEGWYSAVYVPAAAASSSGSGGSGGSGTGTSG